MNMPTHLRLEIGPGENPLGDPENGWEHVGFEAQWGFKPLPFEAQTFNEVYASHVLEHVPWMHTITALQDCLRVLKPGGMLEIWVPNFEYIVQCYLAQHPGDKWRRFNGEGNYMKWVNGRIFTYGPGADNWHHACFDPAYLIQCFKHAGFHGVERIPQRTRGASHGEIDLGVKGFRR